MGDTGRSVLTAMTWPSASSATTLQVDPEVRIGPPSPSSRAGTAPRMIDGPVPLPRPGGVAVGIPAPPAGRRSRPPPPTTRRSGIDPAPVRAGCASARRSSPLPAPRSARPSVATPVHPASARAITSASAGEPQPVHRRHQSLWPAGPCASSARSVEAVLLSADQDVEDRLAVSPAAAAAWSLDSRVVSNSTRRFSAKSWYAPEPGTELSDRAHPHTRSEKRQQMPAPSRRPGCRAPSAAVLEQRPDPLVRQPGLRSRAAGSTHAPIAAIFAASASYCCCQLDDLVGVTDRVPSRSAIASAQRPCTRRRRHPQLPGGPPVRTAYEQPGDAGGEARRLLDIPGLGRQIAGDLVARHVAGRQGPVGGAREVDRDHDTLRRSPSPVMVTGPENSTTADVPLICQRSRQRDLGEVDARLVRGWSSRCVNDAIGHAPVRHCQVERHVAWFPRPRRPGLLIGPPYTDVPLPLAVGEGRAGARQRPPRPARQPMRGQRASQRR